MLYALAKEVPSRILTGVITDVIPDKGLCTVVTTDMARRVYRDIPYSAGYLSDSGYGIDICPERGSYCYILSRTSDLVSDNDAEASVIAFRSPRTGDSNLGSRVKLMPGDIRLSTVGGNELFLRKNGDVFIFSGANCSMSFVSSEEIVKQMSPTYEHEFGAGNVSWQVNSSVAGGPTSCRFGVKRFSSDDEPYLELLAGESISGGLNVTMHMSGGSRSEANLAFELDVDNEGVAYMFFRKDFNLVAQENISISASSSSIIGNTDLTLASTNAFIKITEGKITLSADIFEVLTKNFVVSSYGSSLIASSGEETETPSKVLTSNLFDLIKTHTHLVSPDEDGKLIALPSDQILPRIVEEFETKQTKLL
jgi:hypothetical protein